MDYEIAFKIEVLREYGTSISAAFDRYANENSIGDKNNDHPVVKAEMETLNLASKLLGCPDDEIPVIERRLHELKSYLYEVDPNAII